MPELRVEVGDKVAAIVAVVDVGSRCTARDRLGGVLLGLLSALVLDADDNDRLRPDKLSGVWLGLGDLEGSTLRRGRGTQPACPRSLGVLLGAMEPESRRRRFGAGLAGETDRDLECPWEEWCER